MLMLLVGRFSLAQQEPTGDESIDFEKHVRPILEQRCFACHGVLAQKGNLRLDAASFVRQGGESGSAVIENKPMESLLVDRITSSDPSSKMPPEGHPLTADQVQLIVKWIEQGARVPDRDDPQRDPRMHWSFQPIAAVNVPLPVDTPSRNPIDAFIEQEMKPRALMPLDEADKPTLLRRVTLDLLGVPPTAEELHEYESDDAPDAYDRLVDRLLARPEFGERWGRHWMDVWRYSDWYGRRSVPDVMNSYPHIWRWRDWIVRSLNQDLGYDEMVRQMLAADELYPGDDEKVVATGFLVRNWFKWNYESWMKDNVEHTAKAFLGLTMNCAHCHDHKYDPISQEDYFRFRAFFEPLELRQDRVAGLPDPGPFRKYVYTESYGPITAGLIRVFDEKLDAKTFFYTGGDARNRVEGRPPIEPNVPSFFQHTGQASMKSLPPEAFYPGLREFIRREEIAKVKKEIAIATQTWQQAKSALDQAQKEYVDQSILSENTSKESPSSLQSAQRNWDAAIDEERIQRQNLEVFEARHRSLLARIAADDAKYFAKGDPVHLAKVAARWERRAAYEMASLQGLLAERERTQAETQVATLPSNADAKQTEQAKAALEKATKKLAEVRKSIDDARTKWNSEDTAYSPLSPIYPNQTTGRRAMLANWITSDANPLAARVAANHLWARHFGRPLVDSVQDLGRNGKTPSHPALLDWLATELHRTQWSMKELHRKIVTSHVYRRDSRADSRSAHNERIDPDNRLYWKFSPRRIESEAVRDSLLACSGELDHAIGGQEIEIGQWLGSRRRSLYFSIHGESQVEFIDLFDGPNVCDCYLRTNSVRPQQALALSNSDLSWHQARVLAQSLWPSEGPSDDERTKNIKFIGRAFESILIRSPRDREVELALAFLEAAMRSDVDESPVEGSNPTPGIMEPSSDLAQRGRESLVHALFNHHDFIMLR